MAKIELDVCTPEGKTWLAQAIAIGGHYGIEREFVRYVARDLSRSGKTGTATYEVPDGIYESNEGRRRLGRRYWLVENDEAKEIDRDEAINLLKGTN